MKHRVVFRTQIVPDAKKEILGISDKIGITQIALCSKIVEWFADQPDEVQAAILGLYPDLIRQDVAVMIMEQLAGCSRPLGGMRHTERQ